MKTQTEYRSKALKHRVTMIVEFTKEIDILALDNKEAAEIAENRERKKVNSIFYKMGYSIGDVDIIDVKEING